MSIRPRPERSTRPVAGPQLIRVNAATFIPTGMHGVLEEQYMNEGWRTADLIPTGMHGMGAAPSRATAPIFARLVKAGVHPERARAIVGRAISRIVRRPSPVIHWKPDQRVIPSPLPFRLRGGMLKGMGDAGAADAAAQSWLDRTTQITTEYNDPSYDKSQVHSEAQIAVQGVNALLENRIADISPAMIQFLYQADDALDQVQKDTLQASFQSPWKAGAVAFGQQVSSEVQAGVKALAKTGQNIVDVATTPLTYYVGAALAALVGAKMLHLI